MSDPMPWKVRCICCGYDAGTIAFSTWEDASAFRESYCTGPGVGANGHERQGIITKEPTA